MARKKNLERAIILGLILSTGVYGTALAEVSITNTIRGDSLNDTYNQNVTATANNDSAIDIDDDKVELITRDPIENEKGTITLNANKYGVRLNGQGSVTLDSIDDNVIIVTLVGTSSDENDADGINATNKASGLISFTAKNNSITATGNGTDGIYTDSNNKTQITFTANSGNNDISAGNNGIDHRGNNDITLTAANGANIIIAGTAGEVSNGSNQGDGIRIAGGGNVYLIGTYNDIKGFDEGLYVHENAGEKEIMLTATAANKDGYGNIVSGEDNGIQLDGTGKVNVLAQAGKNYIKGEKVAVYNNGSGNITIQAGQIDEDGVSTLADNEGVDNILTAGESGVRSDGTGTTNVIAANDNIIAGTTNGILSNDEGTIKVTAGNYNTIGQYTDESNVIHTSNTGINVTKGTIIVSSGNNTDIYGKAQGIYNKTGNITVNASGGITVKSEYKNRQSVAIANDNATTGLTAQNINITADGMSAHGISNNNGGKVTLTADNNITVNANGSVIAYGVYTEGAANTTLTNNNGATTIVAGIINDGEKETLAQNGYGVYAARGEAETKISINSKNGNTVLSSTNAVRSEGGNNSLIEIKTEDGSNILEAVNGSAIYSNGGLVNLNAAERNFVKSDKDSAIYTKGQTSKVSLTGKQNKIIGVNGIENTTNGSVTLTSLDDSNFVFAVDKGIILKNNTSSAKDAVSEVKLVTDKNNEIYSNDTAIYTIGTKTVNNAGKVLLDGNNNSLFADKTGIDAATRTIVELQADTANNIQVGNITEIVEKLDNVEVKKYFGDGLAIKAIDEGVVNLTSGDTNTISGAVYARGNKTSITLKGSENVNAQNRIYSYAAIANAGDIDTTTEGSEFTGKTFYSALYAEDGANIKLDGNNIIGTWADSEDDDMLERTVWAYNEGTIDITGAAQIGTDRYDSSPNSADVAIAAGTATNLTKDIVDKYDETDNPRATVTVNYDDFKDENGVSISKSNISGDILSAYAGLVDISTYNSEAGININGNLLAGNNGILSVDLGKGGTLIGRADDYGDAGYVGNIENEGDTNEHQDFYNPAFSSTIYSGGRVDLEMGSGSTWFVTGQSWITSINTEKAQGDTKDTRATIDLTTMYEKDEADATTAHALTVYDFKGDADFKMNLDGNRANSDMLYMKHADGTYRINLVDAVTTDEINSDQNGNEFSGLRFATVGSDSNVNFVVGSYDNGGAFNVEYEVGTDEYGGAETAHENNVYNGSSLNSGKPGSDMVNGFFGSDGEPVSSDNNTESGISTMDLQAANNIMLMSEEAATLDETAAAANDATTDYNATNHKIIARLGEEISDTGKTILNMSRANYSNAIYMDRLNKRLGEARYINSEEDEGMWVRIRHDRIGKDDAYRSQNTMYELGYDQKQECDNGERRVGMAIDYMHGDTGYDQIAGKGEIDRYGLWLYDTWMGDKGHYADYVAKWGHLSNDFEVYTMNDKTKQVTGDYSNNVFSVSAEYGRKKDIGNDWYFEPQVQAQLARVTGADYTTNQGTKVSVDGINSLIGRAGFRLGKDFGEEKQSTVYIKADVLHEFLGDQDVRVLDKSSDNKWAGISYENEGTWYDVGFGFATQMSKNSYAFMDFEKSFGNDNDETYQINVGMQWSF